MTYRRATLTRLLIHLRPSLSAMCYRARCSVLFAICYLLSIIFIPTLYGQSTNGDITLTQEALVPTGGVVGGGNPMQIVASVGEPEGGTLLNPTVTIQAGFQSTTSSLPPGSRTITVQGTTDDPAASVVVNGIAAAVSALTFQASGIVLNEGPNAISVDVTDPAGHKTTKTVTVTLDTHPPARATVAAPAAFTSQTTESLSGTKTPGTSVWINGVEVVSLDNATSWTATVSLIEGDNVLVIVTKDAAGNASATNTITIVRDNQPPVLSVSSPSKTNLNPLTIAGTVDDSLTAVTANGIIATRTGKNFSVAVPLTLGSNTILVKATSPNGYVSTKTLTVTLGTIPTITTLNPPIGTTPYVGTSLTLSATATDQQSDPIEYQFLLSGALLRDWGAASSVSWTPSLAQLGRQSLEVHVRDAFGGENSQSLRVFVIRQPVPPQ